MKSLKFFRASALSLPVALYSFTGVSQAQTPLPPAGPTSPLAPTPSALPEAATPAGPSTPTPTTSANGPVGNIIQPEDVIQVLVTNHPEFSLDSVVVQNNGMVPLPVIGSVKLDGKTPTQAAALIAARLKSQLRQPRVTVVIRQSRPQRVFVLGAVGKAGVYDLPRTGGVAEVLALAGGGTPRAALSQATIKRADGTVIPVDLTRAATQPEANLPLAPGDILVIPESQARFTIRGAVTRPGVVELTEGATVTVSDAIAQSGGALPRAALTRAQITRADGTVVPVDLYKAVILGQPEANVTLGAGDVLTIPIGTGITILGAVPKPGVINTEAGTVNLTDALAQAGGLNVPPAQARITLSRTGENGQTQISEIDAVSLLNLRDPAQNVPLRDGDLISITTREAQTVFISGQVKNPGAYELKEGDSVPELIVRAGGALPEAALRQVSIVKRDGSAQNVDVATAIVEGGDRGKDFPLQQGDFVVIPENKAAVLVLGAVGLPGRKMIPENKQMTLGDALAAAGGARDRARVSQILLLNQDKSAPDGVRRRTVRIEASNQGQLVLNEPLEPGTVVYVPDPKDRSGGPLGIFGSLATIFGLFYR